MNSEFSLNLYKDKEFIGIVTRSQKGPGFALRFGDIHTPIVHDNIIPLELAELMIRVGINNAQSTYNDWQQAHPSDYS